jgi:sugar lactone lactonase YvrE
VRDAWPGRASKGNGGYELKSSVGALRTRLSILAVVGFVLTCLPAAAGGSVLAPAASAAAPTPGLVSNTAGGGTPTSFASSPKPAASAVHGSQLYFTDAFAAVWILNRDTGVARPIAGSTSAGFSGDGGPALGAQFNGPRGIAIDTGGNIFIADRQNHRIRRIDAATGHISTFAGTGAGGPQETGDGGPATQAGISDPGALTFGPDGNLYFASFYTVRRIDMATGIITTVAGGGVTPPSSDGIPARQADLYAVTGISLTANGDLYLSEWGHGIVRRVDHVTGLIWTVHARLVADGPLTASFVERPLGLTLDDSGAIFAASSEGQLVRVDAVTKVTSTIATYARYPIVVSLDHDEAGNLLVSSAEDGHLSMVDRSTGQFRHVPLTPFGFAGDGGPATAATLQDPAGLVRAPSGDLVFADRGNNRVRKIDHTDGTISTVAGTGPPLSYGDCSSAEPEVGLSATMTELCAPSDLAFDAQGNLYVAEAYTGRIRKIDAATNQVSTLVGADHVAAFTVDEQGDVFFTRVASGGDVLRLDHGAVVPTTVFDSNLWPEPPSSLALAPNGDLFVAEPSHKRVVRLTPSTGATVTVLGAGVPGSSGDGGPGPLAAVTPGVVRLASNGDLWVVDAQNGRIRVLRADGVATTATGIGAIGYPPVGATGADVALRNLASVLPGADGGFDLLTGIPFNWGQAIPEANHLWHFQPSVIPAAPTAVSAVGGGASATVSWHASTSPSGAPLAGYRVTAWPGGQSCVAVDAATTCDVTGLPNGQQTTFTVQSRGPAGDSAPSGASVTVTPAVGSRFVPLTPFRVLDSRGMTGGWSSTPLVAGLPRSLQVRSAGGQISEAATAVVVNVTVTNGTAASFLKVYPGGSGEPVSSSLNFAPGETRPNLVTVALGPSGLITFANAAGEVDVVADVAGYYENTTGLGDKYTPAQPLRALDSRTATGGWGSPLAAGTQRDLDVSSLFLGRTPTAVALNVTVTEATVGSFVSVWASTSPAPPTSNLNFGPGQTVANLTIVRVGANGKIRFATASGSVHVVADVVGFFDHESGYLFHPAAPTRVLDDRVGLGSIGPWGPHSTRNLTLSPGVGIRANAGAIAANVTVTNATQGSFVTVFPPGPPGTAPPTASMINFGPNQTVANAALLAIPERTTAIANQLGSVDVIIDVVGYYALR